jgi:predicted O-methyltransferase YrrM
MHLVKSYIKHYFTAKRRGHSVHSPFAYKLCEEVFYNSNKFYDFEELKKLRNTLLQDKSQIFVEDFGAGSKVFKTGNRSINNIVKTGISTLKQSEILYKLVNFLNPETIVELGTSIGLNTLYLIKANKKASVYSIEGSAALSQYAKQLAIKQRANCKFVEGKFDEQLPVILNEIKQLDFLYVDGNHTYGSTINYFNSAFKKANSNSVFVFDDIYWSKEMTKAWNEIKRNPSVTLSIDTFNFGIVFFREEIKERVELKFLV